MKKLLCVSIVVITLALAPSLESQQVGGSAPGPAVEEVPFIFLPSPTIPETEAASRPVPRLADWTVDLTGPWVGGGSNVDIEFEGGLKPGELPLLPWARELRDKRDKKDEPYTSCLPMGVPRVNPYPWKFAMTYTPKGLTHIYVLHETGDAGAHRVIHMDGRKHPVDPLPTWFGHSIGSWDGDTLVVDIANYNDKGSIATNAATQRVRSIPQSQDLHVVERFTRVDENTIDYEATIEDPKVFTAPWRVAIPLHREPDYRIFEYACHEGNLAIPNTLSAGRALRVRPR